MDLVIDWMKHLLMLNKKVEEEKLAMEPGIAVPTPVVELIFHTCAFFEQPDEVRCLSVELFDRFVRLHFNYLLNKVWSGSRISSHEKWASVEKTLSTQTSLRILSCIQIASKFIFQPKIITGKEVRKFLEAEGKSFTLASIKASEMRVWKTLDFRAYFPTVLTNVEVLLEQIKSSLNTNLTDIEERVVLFTDVVYLHHQEIFCKLYYMTTGRWDPTPNEKREFVRTECSLMYRAAAVVALSVTFASGNSDDETFQQVARLTNISSDKIKSLANIIQSIVLS